MPGKRTDTARKKGREITPEEFSEAAGQLNRALTNSRELALNLGITMTAFRIRYKVTYGIDPPNAKAKKAEREAAEAVRAYVDVHPRTEAERWATAMEDAEAGRIIAGDAARALGVSKEVFQKHFRERYGHEAKTMFRESGTDPCGAPKPEKAKARKPEPEPALKYEPVYPCNWDRVIDMVVRYELNHTTAARLLRMEPEAMRKLYQAETGKRLPRAWYLMAEQVRAERT